GRDGRWGAGGVVSHECEPHARRGRLGQRLGRSGDGGSAEVDNPVEVEQRDVIPSGKGLSGTPQRHVVTGRGAAPRGVTRHGGTGHLRSSPSRAGGDGGSPGPACVRAASVARTPRSASA